VRCTFQCLDQILHVVVAEPGGQPQWPGVNYEWLSFSLPGHHQAQAEKVIHGRLQRGAGPTELAAQQLGDIVIKRESGSHTLMIAP
jgi:hypothetical protein